MIYDLTAKQVVERTVGGLFIGAQEFQDDAPGQDVGRAFSSYSSQIAAEMPSHAILHCNPLFAACTVNQDTTRHVNSSR